jgi:hypothetical protein
MVGAQYDWMSSQLKYNVSYLEILDSIFDMESRIYESQTLFKHVFKFE